MIIRVAGNYFSNTLATGNGHDIDAIPTNRATGYRDQEGQTAHVSGVLEGSAEGDLYALKTWAGADENLGLGEWHKLDKLEHIARPRTGFSATTVMTAQHCAKSRLKPTLRLEH